MCVAVVVDSKDRIPAKHLEAMHDANPHGAGIAWCDGTQIAYRKGMTWKEIDSIQMMIRRPFFMHFRIKTHGPTIPELTHPFPLGEQAFTKDLVGLAPGVLMHNGSWSDFRKFVPEGIDPSSVSDTQVAAYVANWREDILKGISWATAIMRATDVAGRVNLTLRGRWTNIDGNQFSNDYWKKELQPKWTYSGKSNTDWTEWKGWTKERSDDLRKAQQSGDWDSYSAKYYPNGGGNLPTTSRTKTQPATQKVDKTTPRKKGESRLEGTEELFTPRALADATGKYLDDKNCMSCGEALGSSYRYHNKMFLHSDCEAPNINSNSVKCEDCLNEITTIPCPCTAIIRCPMKACNSTNVESYDEIWWCGDCYHCWDPNQLTQLNDDTPANNGVKIVPSDEIPDPWEFGVD